MPVFNIDIEYEMPHALAESRLASRILVGLPTARQYLCYPIYLVYLVLIGLEFIREVLSIKKTTKPFDLSKATDSMITARLLDSMITTTGVVSLRHLQYNQFSDHQASSEISKI